jgi:hypothetical protein
MKTNKNQCYDLAKVTKKILGEENVNNVVIALQKNKIPIPEFVMMFQAIGKLLLKEIKPSSLNVFWLFICKMEYSNHIGIDQLTIAEETGLSSKTVWRSINELKERNIIISYSDVQDKRRKIYIINPQFAWKGTATERMKKIRMMETKLNIKPLVE